MSLSAGSTIYTDEGTSYRLYQEVGRGGEGSVWSLDNDQKLVAKFYHNELKAEHIAKLTAMCKLKSDALNSVAAWPIALLRPTRSSSPRGLLMRKVSGYHSVHQLYGLKSRLRIFPEAQFPFLLHSAINIARAFATIHSAGQVIGDVNHSNLMLSPTATAALIDCDSFQISDNGKLFPCPVGVPEFTPPELQGMSFASQTRTANHDAFGLGVLIFYLLFLGRHPFMGMCDVKTGDMVTLDQAIRQFTFPYVYPPNSPEVRLPTFVPRLEDYPSTIRQYFVRAFTRDALSKGRPTSSDWVQALTDLSNNLQKCKTNPNHHFYQGVKDCPWCRVEARFGTPVFGIKIAFVGNGNTFSLVAVWAEIEAVRATPEWIARPDVNALQQNRVPDAALADIKQKRRKHRIVALSLPLLPMLASAFGLNPGLAIAAIFIALIVAAKVWGNGNKLAKPFTDALESIENDYNRASSDLEQSEKQPEPFVKAKTRLEGAKKDYQNLAPEKAKRLAKLQAERERKQLQHFLERFRIEDDVISGIGPKNKLLLRSWGIEDAWDVEISRMQGIKGFGPVKQQTLLDWRQSKQTQFRFDQSQGIDPRDIHALEQEFAQKASTLQTTLRTGPNALRQSVTVWNSERKQLGARVNVLAEKLAQAKVDAAYLGRF